MLVSAVSDEEGKFELRGLSAGRRSVVVSAANHHSQIVSALDIAAGTVNGPVRVELSPVAKGDSPKLDLAGIGVALRADEEGLLVQAVLEGGGAQEAGIQVGDLVIEIDGENVRELGWDDSIQRMRGPAGSDLELHLLRAGEEIVKQVTRRVIRT